MKKLAVLVLVIGVLGCNRPEKPGTEYSGTSIYVWHDDAHEVTCWIYTTSGHNGGISCLPDSEVRR